MHGFLYAAQKLAPQGLFNTAIDFKGFVMTLTMEKIYLRCNVCEKSSLEVSQIVIDLPYFGPTQIVSMRCQSCGVKSSDFYVVDEQPPRRFTFRVKNEAQLNVRVIRSAKGRITIPEFKFELTPGPVSNAIITNIEGLLFQVKSTVDTLKRWSKEPNDVLASIETRLSQAFKGQYPFTVIIEDPTGKSGIIPSS